MPSQSGIEPCCTSMTAVNVSSQPQGLELGSHTIGHNQHHDVVEDRRPPGEGDRMAAYRASAAAGPVRHRQQVPLKTLPAFCEGNLERIHTMTKARARETHSCETHRTLMMLNISHQPAMITCDVFWHSDSLHALCSTNIIACALSPCSTSLSFAVVFSFLTGCTSM